MVELSHPVAPEHSQQRSDVNARSVSRGSIVAIAWRNLWRNRRRTWLSAGGIGFAVWMLVLSLSMQDGSFEAMIDNGSRLLLGHVQIQHTDYSDDPRIEYTISVSPAEIDALRARPEVTAVAPRVQAFALVSSGDRSFGAQVLGVDPAVESRWSSLPSMIGRGRYLSDSGEAVIGATLARNIGAGVGDELVMLGTAAEGGVAAAVAEIVGLFETGQSELDRGIVQLSIEDFRVGWELGDQELHALLLIAESVASSELLAARLEGQVPGAVLDWRELMPEAEQTIEMKAIGAYFFFALIACIVTFSVVNTFMMTVFERTREFGMLLALGMKPRAVMLQLQLEALWLSLLGIGTGLLLAAAFIVPLMSVGVALPDDAGEMLKRFNMPDRMYPVFSTTAAWVSALIMLVGAQLAALIPGLRVLKLRPVEALRAT
jgi:ABC-type lipoprotein release transport system permease subunit